MALENYDSDIYVTTYIYVDFSGLSTHVYTCTCVCWFSDKDSWKLHIDTIMFLLCNYINVNYNMLLTNDRTDKYKSIP